jgi:hypothetical protein
VDTKHPIEAGNTQEQTCLIEFIGEQCGQLMKLCESGVVKVFGVLKKGADPAEEDNDMEEEAV